MTDFLLHFAIAVAAGVIVYHALGWLRRPRQHPAIASPPPAKTLDQLFDLRASGFSRPELLARALEAIEQFKDDERTGIAIMIVEPDGATHGFLTGPPEYERRAVSALLDGLVQRSPHWRYVASACRAALGLADRR